MKNTWLFYLILISFSSCKKDLASTTPLQEMVDTSILAVKYNGAFVNGPYGSVSGNVTVYKDSINYLVRLVNVLISNGPDLHVYLSKGEQPLDFIDLGKLKSVSGSQVYAVTGDPDFLMYKYVLIHCQQYNHLFGSAQLR